MAGFFPSQGTHLERYAARFPAVEIDTSFYRTHRPSTYARWAQSVPPDFRFSVKLPRQVTHAGRLKDPSLLVDFLSSVQSLGEKLGVLLVQLPPSLKFEPTVVSTFFTAFRSQYQGGTACEPRHPSWFQPAAREILASFQVARVAADPAIHPLASAPGGWEGLIYYRLHGSPRIYYSAYSSAFLEDLAQKLAFSVQTAPTWCIFDNTAEFAATRNALELLRRSLD
jgi:uncharacterized protein YecE (DUF72 family)